MKKNLLFFLLFILSSTMLWAQQKTVSGIVKDNTATMPGVSVLIKGTKTGTVTNIDGYFKLVVTGESDVLVFSFIGYKSKEVIVGNQTSLNLILEIDSEMLEEVVVTAMGVSRDKKSLGYSVQTVAGKSISETKNDNVVAALSGKVAGVQIKQPASMGGSANILIRGTSSLGGSNQPLFVIDGVPINNSTFNEADQDSGKGGYDYGNLASDVNPDDVETISVLKGAAATALYGSRASNGVVLITTKSGKIGRNKGLGVSFNTGITFSKINQATMPKHQKEYGAGYGAYYSGLNDHFYLADVDGDGTDDLITVTAEDASWGERFDPNLMVVHWDALDPTQSNYGEKRPWVAGANGIDYFFETGVAKTANIALDGGSENATFRLSYTNSDISGILPNSSLKKNTFTFRGTSKLSDKLTASSSVSYVNTNALGRAGTGYVGINVMQAFGQWFQTNLDLERLKNNWITKDGRHRSWNRANYDTEQAIYFDNPYWLRYKNFNNDNRDRVYGNISLTYKLTDWLSASARVAMDHYSYLQEERIAKQSVDLSHYTKRLRTFSERNYNLTFNFNKKFSDGKISLTGLAGVNGRKEIRERTSVATVDGLIEENLYTITNSVSSIIKNTEYYGKKTVNGLFASASIGYNGILYLDIAGRNDFSSTLPTDNNSYFYPSISSSFIFSELISSDIFSFGKLRLGWAKIGNDTNPYTTLDYYSIQPNFSTTPLYSVPSTLNNSLLVPEETNEVEVGLELMFLDRRIGLDIAYYNRKTENQILAIDVSRASGYSRQYINAGIIENKGIELALTATPLKLNNGFEWNISINWTRNRNKVLELIKNPITGEDKISNIQLGGDMRGGVSINARVGQPYGTIVGANYQFHKNGSRIVGPDGRYLTSKNSEVLGDSNPDWIAGITNTFSFKGLRLSFLLDMQKGGDIFSLNTRHGQATGVYAETAGLNELGKPVRGDVADGGGILFDGVYEDGSKNTTRVPAQDFFGAFYYGETPAARWVYDVSYVKFRELNLSYKLPNTIFKNLPFQNVVVSFVGRNLAILSKNVEHFDPEAGLGAGNIQGYESGVMPSARTYGFNLKFNF